MEFNLHAAYLCGVALAIVLPLLMILKGVYNVFFHPLSSYPGPWYLAASDLVRLYYLTRGDFVRPNHRLHLRYGPVVRVGPKELSFIEADAWRDIYGHNKNELVKDPHFFGKTPNGVNHIGTADREEHRRMRSIFSHAFSDRALKKQQPLIRDFASTMVRQIEKQMKQNGKVNMFNMYNFAAFDIMATLTFGESLGLLEATAYTPWVKALFQSLKFMTIRGAVLKVPVVGQLLHLLTDKTLKRQFQVHFEYSSAMVDHRLAQGDIDKADIWSFVLNQKSRNLSLDEMHSNGFGFMIGGGETTSTTLSGLTYLLIRHPHVLRRLLDELQQAGVGPETSWSSLAQLEYLNACITETLRIYPPAAAGLARITTPGGTLICGKIVPEDTVVYVSQYAANRSPTHFHLADEFHPERWIPGEDLAFKNDKKEVAQPFSVGPRNCLGQHLAWHEMRVLICSTILNFENLRLLSEDEDWLGIQKVYITWEKPPLMIQMKRKEF
nr:cytochrome P450 monooxygenase NecC [Nectria sp. HLS206]